MDAYQGFFFFFLQKSQTERQETRDKLNDKHSTCEESRHIYDGAPHALQQPSGRPSSSVVWRRCLRAPYALVSPLLEVLKQKAICD